MRHREEHVVVGVDLVGQLVNFDLETALNLLQDCVLVRVWGDERDGETARAKAAGTADAVEVLVGLVRHVVVNDDVDLLDVDATAEQVGSDHNALVEVLERLVAFQPLLHVQPRVDADGREVALLQQFV